MNNRIGIIVLALTASLFAATASARQDKAAAAAPSIAGTWNISLMGHPIALVLEQDGKKVTGTLMMMGKDVPVDGAFADGTLTLTSPAQIGAPGGHDTVPLALTAKLKEDGTLAGEITGPHGPMEWTAERLRQRKPATATSAGKASDTPPAIVAGTWNMSVMGDHGVPIALVLEQSGRKVTGTMMIHDAEVVLDGEFVDGVLTLSSAAEVKGGDGQTFGKVKLAATLKEDGTLAGEFDTARGPMKMTAERLKRG